ncbi:hypothetical protein AWENTII_002209 [Aspergillus wentii]
MVFAHLPVFDDPDPEDPSMISCPGYAPEAGDVFLELAPEGTNELIHSGQAYLVHDACLDILRIAHKKTVSRKRPFSIREFSFEMSSRVRDFEEPVIRWGDDGNYGGTGRFQDQEWDPRPGFEWLVADPFPDFDFASLISASSRNQTTTTLNLHSKQQSLSGPNVYTDGFQCLPHDIRLIILDFLPSPSAMNLFIASPSFRYTGQNVTGSFWKSRIFLDMPWYEEDTLRNQIKQEKKSVQYSHLFHLLKHVSALPGRNDGATDYLQIKNRHRIWLNCQRILGAIERRFAQTRKESGRVRTQMKNLAKYRLAPISRETSIVPEAFSDVYFIPSVDRPEELHTITAHFGIDGCIIGIEFALYGEESSRLFGNRSTSTESVTINPETVITGFLISQGPFQSDKEKYCSIYGLGILTQDSPKEPKHRLGKWTDLDLVQIIRAVDGMQVVGITGEYNRENITTFGIMFTHLHSMVYQIGANPYYHTRWIGRYPPPEYSLGNRLGDLSVRFHGQGPLRVGAPVFFLDFAERQITSIQAHYFSESLAATGPKEFSGFTINFTDGSKEVAGVENGEQDHHECSNHTIDFQTDEQERIKMMNLLFGSDESQNYTSKLHAVQFRTSLGRMLTLGHIEVFGTENYRHLSHGDWIRGNVVSGLQIGWKNVVTSMGLVFSKPRPVDTRRDIWV